MQCSYIDQGRLWYTVASVVWVALLLGLITVVLWIYSGRVVPFGYAVGLGGLGTFTLLLGIVGMARGSRALTQASLVQVAQDRQDFDALYAHSPIAYLTIDVQGNIKRANPAAVHLLGEQVDTVTQGNFYSYLHEPSTDRSNSVLRGEVSAGLTVTDVELPILRAEDDVRWVLLNVYSADQPHERLMSITDITQQRAVDTAKSEFVALATHQLRTPIAAIRWNVELLIRSMRDTQTDKQSRYLTKIDRNVVRTLNLINDFLSVSKLEMGTFAAELETVEFQSYLAGILEEFEEKITSHQLQVNTSVEPTDMHVSIDRRLFHIISSNLISNAVKYTPTGGTVSVTAQAQGSTFVFRVADTGIGIPEHEQAQLFTKFFRATNAQQQVTEGTGLGLYVVKQSVEILSGALTVESVEDKGTTFVVTLPGVVR